MTLLVPFDGSPLAVAALRRAAELAPVFDEAVVAVTVVKSKNVDAAREAGWLREGEPYDLDTIVKRLREQVADHAPEATFTYDTVDRYAPRGTVSKRIRSVATERDASIVVIGSDNAGHFVTSLSSVGGSLTAGSYDVLIVRES